MKKISSRVITGLIIVIIGVALFLSNLNVLSFGDLVGDWWPLLIVLAGVIIFINNTRSYLWALLVVVFGIMLQLNHLDIISVSPWQLIWPVVIVVIGLSIVLSRKGAVVKADKAERQDVTAILSGSDQKNSSSNFKGSKITAVMGGAQLDLRKATINKEATIEVFAFWGGIEILVPKNVLVKSQITNIIGGTDDKAEAPVSTDAPVLNIVGDVIMAGVEIKS